MSYDQSDIDHLVSKCSSIGHHVTQMTEWGWHVSEIAAVAWRMATTYYNYECFDEERYDFADNMRYARAGIPEEVEAYEAAVNRGCCGSYDDLIFAQRDGGSHAVMFGFNYGH